MSERRAWPAHLEDDFAGATVRLTTLMQSRAQYLLFGCVELYPHEIPLPPQNISPLTQNVRGATLVSGVAVMPVAKALAWYESALAGALKVPGIAHDVTVTAPPLAAEPALGRLVVANELPFATRWHGGPRLHHLVPLDDGDPSIAWLTSIAINDHRDEARKWLTQNLGFDLLAYDEFLFSLVLLVPNPLVRSFGTFIRQQLPTGGERLGVSVTPRRGASLAELQVRIREERTEGTSLIADCALDPFGLAELDLPEPCYRTGLEVVSAARGLLGIMGPAQFFRGRVSVTSEVIAPKGTVEVPARRAGERPEAYTIHTRHGDRVPASKPDLPNAQTRLIDLRSRRLTRPGEARPDGFWQGGDGEERIFIADRTNTVAFIRSLLARAKKRVVFVDPYFNHIDVREFAVATQYQDVEVHALIGRGDPLWSRPSAAARDGSVAGDLFAEDLRALEERLKAAGRQLPGVRLMGDTSRTYHDRFLVIDDDVWHFGHSFNQVGEGDVSMATRLRYPDSIRDLIVEDVERAALFIEAWPALRATRQQARKTLCARVAAWVARLCAWAASLQGGERGVENARPRESEAAL